MIRELKKREQEFKKILQEAEGKAWSNIPFSQKFFNGVVLNSSLSEPLSVKGDYIHATFMNEFDNVDHSDFQQ